MKLKPLIRKSIRSFYDGELPTETIEASGKPFLYTMEFFDMLAEQNLEEVEEDAEQE
jgi:hypothetical protein